MSVSVSISVSVSGGKSMLGWRWPKACLQSFAVLRRQFVEKGNCAWIGRTVLCVVLVSIQTGMML